MAVFKGSLQEFNRYIGPFGRNIIQQLTRTYKSGRACEHCGRTTGTMEAAHVHGEERVEVIRRLLEEHYRTGDDFEIDLVDFTEKFKNSHLPLENHFKILCRQCHEAYDSEAENAITHVVSQRSNSIIHQEMPIVRHIEPGAIAPEIELVPENREEFKRLLLEQGCAVRTWYYSDGTEQMDEWDASKMTETSNVMQNIKTNGKYKKWRENGIVKVKVEV